MRWTRAAVALGGSVAIIFVLWPGVAIAATSPSATTTIANGTSTDLKSGDVYGATIVALAFGFLAIVAVLIFLYFDRNRSFKLATGSMQRRLGFKTTEEKALASLAVTSSGVAAIEGPYLIEAGESAVYQTKPSSKMTWTVHGQLQFEDPETAKSPTNAIWVTGVAVGSGTLTVTDPSDATKTSSQTIRVKAAQSDPMVTIPFLGIGYGTVIISLAVASVTAALGISGVITGEAVATVLGSLVTYSVVKGTSSASSKGSTD